MCAIELSFQHTGKGFWLDFMPKMYLFFYKNKVLEIPEFTQEHLLQISLLFFKAYTLPDMESHAYISVNMT